MQWKILELLVVPELHLVQYCFTFLGMLTDSVLSYVKKLTRLVLLLLLQSLVFLLHHGRFAPGGVSAKNDYT